MSAETFLRELVLQTEAGLLFKGEALAAFLLKPGAVRDAHSHVRAATLLLFTAR